MKLYNYFFYVLLLASCSTFSMQRTKNWTSHVFYENGKQIVRWRGNDTREMVTLYYEPATGIYRGKKINHRWPNIEIQMIPERVRQYLVELKEIPEKA